jgi:hypothetical protein
MALYGLGKKGIKGSADLLDLDSRPLAKYLQLSTNAVAVPKKKSDFFRKLHFTNFFSTPQKIIP